MATTNQAEWRGWIWIAVSLCLSFIAGGFSLFEQSTHYTDKRLAEVHDEIGAQIGHMRDDIRIIHGDIKQLLRENRSR
jgi:hypothetical protein